jgi:ribosomal protein S18 acetylase RimI-like enzyme
MPDVEIRSYLESDQDAVVDLWRESGLVVPWNDPVKDIRRKLRVQPDMFLVGLLGTRLAGTVMVGYEGHRGWINYLAVAADCRHGGFGRRLMDEAETRLRALGCPKINLQVRTSNTSVIAFYERIGYSVDDVVSMGKRLEDDRSD